MLFRAYRDTARGIDAVSALDAWGLGLPGFAGMKLDPTAGPGMGLDVGPGQRSPFLHFPDGNATLARLLVQRLIPRVRARNCVLAPGP
jgi:spermidine dehydrogenase